MNVRRVVTGRGDSGRLDSTAGRAFEGRGACRYSVFPTGGRITVHRQFFRAAISRIEMKMRRVVGEKFVES